MENILVSVVIPVYNAQDYIARCVESILCQSHRNFELILIVDGATDNSLSVCLDLQKQDPRIHVVSKENEGVSATRNLGIELAKGEYISFVDADDIVTEDYLEKLLRALLQNDATLALCGYQYLRQEGAVPSGEPERRLFDAKSDSLYEQYIRAFFRIDGAPYFMGSACRSMMHTALLRQYEIRFPPCRIYEDQLFIMSVMGRCERIAFVNEAMYYYDDMVAGSAIRARYKKDLPADQSRYLEHLAPTLQWLPINAQQKVRVHCCAVLNARKLVITNAAMNPDTLAGKKEIREIRASALFEERIPLREYVKWLVSQPIKSIAAEILLKLRMYGMLRRLRSM